MAPSGSPATRTSPFPVLVSLLVLYLSSSTQAIRFLGYSDTYARYPVWNACSRASLSFEFKTRQPSAMLVYTDDNGRYDFLQLALAKGNVKLFITFKAEENRYVDIEANTQPLNDDNWHRVEIRRNRMETVLFVDGTQTSKVALGSESDDVQFDEDRMNHVFFGGIPNDYRKQLPEKFTDERFRGELRNILYFNCSCTPVRAVMVDGEGVSRARREACERRDPCPKDCVCVSADGEAGCECSYKRECLKNQLVSYHLPMDEVQDDALINFSGLDSVVGGNPSLVRGVRNKALLLRGRTQWLRVTGADHRKECMGDLSKCDKGYYMGMWLQFRDVVGREPGVYLSNGGHGSGSHGVALLYTNGRLQVVFKLPNGTKWRAETSDVLNGRWHHVAASWREDQGLFLYVDGELKQRDQRTSRSAPASRTPRHNAFYIGRGNDNQDLGRLGSVVVDDFVFVAAFKSAAEVREAGAIPRFYLSFDKAEGKRLPGHGLTGRMLDQAERADGKVGKGVAVYGSRGFVDLGEVTDTCLGDLDLCTYGLYVSLWFKVSRVDGGITLLSAPVFEVRYRNSLLVVLVKKQRQEWQISAPGPQEGEWHFLEFSWSSERGLSVYVDRQFVGNQVVFANRPPEPLLTENLRLGWSSNRQTRVPGLLDELNIYYADRETLAKIDYILTGRPENLHFDMNELSRGRLPHRSMLVGVLGSPRVVDGKVDTAIYLDGNNDALDFGEHTNVCFGNLDMCAHGLLVSLWLRPQILRDGVYYLSTGTSGLSLLYDERKLKVRADTASHSWEVSTSDFQAEQWYFLEVSFHPERGLQLYKMGELVAESKSPDSKVGLTLAKKGVDRFYLGRNNDDGKGVKYSAGTFDELDVWYADRDYLTSQGFIQRGRPESIIIHFEEMSQDRQRLIDPYTDIKLTGSPRLVTGKIGYALQLRGNGQYADLGSQAHSCMGNLARCQHGITVSAWMKFRSFQNDMVFLSTGDPGLQLLFKDGFVLAKADGRDQISAPRFQPNRWYHVEMSWHPDHGLKLFVDGRQVQGTSIPYTYRSVPSQSGGKFYIGRPNSADVSGWRYVTGDFDIDELEVWFFRREDLLAFGYIDREEPGCEMFSMDSSQGKQVVHPKHTLQLVNGATLAPGRQGNALQLDGYGEYLDMGRQVDSCLGNLDKCPHGFTLSVWLKPNALSENMHFISAPSYFLFYEDGRISAEFISFSQRKTWVVSTPNFVTGEWQRVTLAWHQLKGLRMFLNDHLVDTSAGTRSVQNDKPESDHLYIGRSLADTRLTAAVEVDELQICNDDFDQLLAKGTYQVEVFPTIILFDTLRNGYIVLRNRRIYARGNPRLRDGLQRNARAVYLNGMDQYLDFDDDFFCSGDLDTCRDGMTFRLSVKPETLREGMYLVDSFPLSMYYRNGRLHGEARTKDYVWTVDTPEFPRGLWSRVEMRWIPSQGLALYVNGQRMDYQTYPDARRTGDPSERKTYLGRPVELTDGSYSNISVDNMEYYNTYSRDRVGRDDYLNLVRDYLWDLEKTTQQPPTRRPTVRPERTTKRPDRVGPPTQPGQGASQIIRLNGASYVRFNFSRLPSQYLTRTQQGDLTMMFLTDQPDGLLWLQERPGRTMYVALKGGRLVFVNDEQNGSPDQIVLGEAAGVRFNDGNWHKLMIRRVGRRIQLTVDEQHREEYTFRDDVQFLTPAQVWLGGTVNTAGKTRGLVTKNFRGGIAQVIYRTNQRDGQRIIRNEVNLVSQLKRGSPTGVIEVETITDRPRTTRPPVTVTPPVTQQPPVLRSTSISVVRQGVAIPVRGPSLGSRSSVAFSFKTLNQDGVMLFSGQPQGKFFAVELVDGRLYFVHNFGGRTTRTAFSQKVVADGQLHDATIRFYPGSHVDLRVGAIRNRAELAAGEKMPEGLGPLYVAGLPDGSLWPWKVWSRQGYIGCLNDLSVDDYVIDFEDKMSALRGAVMRNCIPVSQACTLDRPCAHGLCRNTMIGYFCDCSATHYRGPRCSLDAWTALFNGSTIGQLDLPRTLVSHSDDLSLRFRTPAKDGLLFQTFAKNSNRFLRASLENGRVKVETNLGGQNKVMYTGKDLNDLMWHTLHIQRHGNEMEIWVDDLPHATETLAGEGYFLNVDRIHLGGMKGANNNYIGYLQNFYLNQKDILEGVRGSNLQVDRFPNLPPLIYHAVTFPDLKSYVPLAPLDNPQDMELKFMFKTKEPSGILMFTSGNNQAYLVVELFEGNLYIQFSAVGSQPLRVLSDRKVNDNKWHSVTIQREAADQQQFLLTVDGVTSSVSYAGSDPLNFNEKVYIGGVPEEVFKEEHIKRGVFSRTGFRGCLASVDLSGKVVNLAKVPKPQGVTVYDSCRAIISRACTADSCKNYGMCVEVGPNTFTCDCKMSAHSGAVCLDEPIGFRYKYYTKADKDSPGLLEYSFPVQTTTGSAVDQIAFGVMTKQDDAVLLRVFSEVFKDYIEFRLRDGYVEASYDTDGKGGRHAISQRTQKVNDGKTYHIVRFIRTADNATLFVDNVKVTNLHTTKHGNFDRMSKIYIGGSYDRSTGKIIDSFDGILGGLHINGLLVFPEASAQRNTRYIGDVFEAPRPFNLLRKGGDTIVIVNPSTTPPPPPSTSPSPSRKTVPGGMGGSGIGWGGPGGTGVDTNVYPGGNGGTGGLVPGAGGGGGAGGGPSSAGLGAAVPPLSGPGPRAGAVVGIVLGVLALLSGLMWAFVRCKPGWCTCLKPPVEDAVVSAPLLSASNKGAVLAAGGGVSGAGGTITGMGAGTEVNGASNAFSNYYLSSSGTGIGTPQPGRMQLGSTATAASIGAYSGQFHDNSMQMKSMGGSVDRMDGNAMISPASLQSYHYEGAGESTTADYDLVTGIVPGAGYQTNTLSSRGGFVSGESLTGGGYSTNTMQSSYAVRTLGSVSGQQQIRGYVDSNVVGIPPGALGEEVRVDCCLMNSDGRSVITGSSLGPPQIWDMQSGELLRIMQGETVGSTNLHLACNDTLLVGCVNADLEANQYSVPKGVNNYLLQIWDQESGRPFAMSHGEKEVCSAMCMMSDNDKVIFARTDKFGSKTFVVAWDLLGNQPIKDMRYDAPVGNNDFVHYLALSQSGRYVIAGFTNSIDSFAEFIVFDMTLTTYAVSDLTILRMDAIPECTAVLPHDEAVTGLRNGELVIWSMRTGQPSRQLMAGSDPHAHAREVKAVALSDDNMYLASASADGTVKVWDMNKERHLHTLIGHTDEVWCCTISSDSEIVVSGSRDRTIRLWKVRDGSATCSFNAGVDIFHVNMSRDKATIVGLGDKLGARKLVMLQVVRTKVRRQVDE